MGSPVFKTGGGSKGPRRVRFPSASAKAPKTLVPQGFSETASFHERLPISQIYDLVSVRCPSGVRQRSEIHRVHPSSEGFLIGREEVSVAVKGHLYRRVTQLCLYRLRVGSGGDEE